MESDGPRCHLSNKKPQSGLLWGALMIRGSHGKCLLLPLAIIQECPAGPHPEGLLSLLAEARQYAGTVILPSLARRRYRPRNGRCSQAFCTPGEWPRGIVDVPGLNWQVTRINLWKGLTLGVLALAFSGDPKNLKSLNSGRCGCYP